MRSFRLSLAACALGALALAACSGGGGGPTVPSGSPSPGPSPSAVPSGSDIVKANVPRATSTNVSDSELAALVAGNTEFAFELFRIAAREKENTLLSPYSIAAALTMTHAGARGPTAGEMRAALHFGLPDDRLHAARNELDLRVTAAPTPGAGDERAPFTIRVANSLWGQEGYPFLPEFLELLAKNYDAGMNIVDFQTAAESARVQINEWVEKQTEGRIVDLIPEGVVNDLTRLVLVNAIWFKANWASQFDPKATTDDTFHTLAGQQVKVPTMHQSGRLLYSEGPGYKAVRLPYAGDASMLVVLPDQGAFEQVAGTFGAQELAAIEDKQAGYAVDLALPKFEFRSQLAMKPALQELGIHAAFVEPSRPDGADLTGMTSARELFVRDVVHQAFIAVDETGTEAAAATAVIVGNTSLPPPATMTVDRPFLFVIQHNSTGEVLFVGQVVDPR